MCKYKSKYLISIVIIILLMSCVKDPYNKFKGKDLYLVKGEKQLFWFNGIHSNDPNHKMFNDIEKKFSEFKPDCVFVEGGYNRHTYKNRNEAIVRGNEPGYVSYLAKQKNIDLFDIEPDDESQYKYLLGKFNEQDILLMYVVRQIYQLQRESENREIDIIDYFNNHFLPKMKQNGFPLTDEQNNINNTLQMISGYANNREFTVKNWKDIPSHEIIYQDTGIIHKIWEKTINFRDIAAIEKITETYDKYDRIFIMMGGDHIKNQETELKKLFE